jgi:hypothetical protein
LVEVAQSTHCPTIDAICKIACIEVILTLELYQQRIHMDIFNSATRSREEAIKSPLNYPESSITERRLKDDN